MTAVDDRIEAVRALLAEAEQAHGVYETTELNGVYDQDWPRWYAAYAVEHGIGDLIGHAIIPDQLSAFLAGGFADFKAIEPAPTQGWAAHTAQRIVAEL